jgi:hypothetical protein
MCEVGDPQGSAASDTVKPSYTMSSSTRRHWTRHEENVSAHGCVDRPPDLADEQLVTIRDEALRRPEETIPFIKNATSVRN